MKDDVLVLIILANVGWAARQTWDTGEFKDARKAFRAKYQASHVHDATSSTDIMAILAEADEAQDLSQADAPTGMALTIDEGLSFLDALTDGNYCYRSGTLNMRYHSCNDARKGSALMFIIHPHNRVEKHIFDEEYFVSLMGVENDHKVALGDR